MHLKRRRAKITGTGGGGKVIVMEYSGAQRRSAGNGNPLSPQESASCGVKE
jgi:hypothetical protein